MILGFTYYQAKNGRVRNLQAKYRFNREVLKVAQSHGVEGFTLLRGIGAWQGKTEPTFQMQLEGVSKKTARSMAVALRDTFEQDAVMLKDGEKVQFI